MAIPKSSTVSCIKIRRQYPTRNKCPNFTEYVGNTDYLFFVTVSDSSENINKTADINIILLFIMIKVALLVITQTIMIIISLMKS